MEDEVPELESALAREVEALLTSSIPLRIFGGGKKADREMGSQGDHHRAQSIPFLPRLGDGEGEGLETLWEGCQTTNDPLFEDCAVFALILVYEARVRGQDETLMVESLGKSMLEAQKLSIVFMAGSQVGTNFLSALR